MSKTMLIDAVHPEETRVALISEGRVDDFDFETAGKKQLRGNIYLAKVTRVEPSLQAAFVDYGGNRHGFLAFSEIHPDYYQLPQEDREALLREEAEFAAAEAADDDNQIGEDDEPDDDTDDDDTANDVSPSEADEAAEEARPRRRKKNTPTRRYKIQEVIRRRQVMLVQVVKEERGNKGAALTTYLSLAGRYCVLMPNTPRGGGISRKIADSADRKRLKKIMGELDVPTGMGLIVRTAGAKRTKTEIKRDFDYLQKLWEKVRDLTLQSMAPCLINEEGGLVHRAMRDLYDKDVQEVLIQGDAAYREAKDLAKLLMPSHAKRVKHWKDTGPLFVERGVEEQLGYIFSPIVKLKSGGYLVINQTEALVAIDVNSGKSTRERNIEQTALRTNLEAAEEACRQMRLRDLAGLVVIDFIDMDESKNNRAVEKRLKDCLKRDRARVQYGRISQFGLMEISRQRRRAGVLDASSDPCPQCQGTGRVRSVPSAGLQLLRAIEARAATGGLLSITVSAPAEVAIYLLNAKREVFSAIEESAGVSISFEMSDGMLIGDFAINAEKDPNAKRRRKSAPIIEGDPDDEAFAAAAEAENDALEDDADVETAMATEGKKRKRRRGRGRSREGDGTAQLDVIDLDDSDAEGSNDTHTEGQEQDNTADRDSENGDKRRRRRGRRGGRRRRRSDTVSPSETAIAAAEATERALALPPIKSTPPTGKDLPTEDGGAYLDGLIMAIEEMLDGDLAAVLPSPDIGELPPEKTDEAESEQAKDATSKTSRRGRRRKSKEPVDATPPVNEMIASPEEGEESEKVTVETLPTVTDESTSPEELAPKEEPPAMERTASEVVTPPGTVLTPSITETVEAAPSPSKVEPQADIVMAETAADTPAPKPKRRGWWSRR